MEIIEVTDPGFQTIIFGIILIGAIILSGRPSREQTFFSKDVTNEVKGLAILMIVISHIGYFLVSNNKFLYPFSILPGVGVNLFLILSGFGLTMSQLQKPLNPLRFYQKRLLKLFVPIWIVIPILLGLDYLLLHRSYPIQEIWQALVGFFPRADVGINLDSPLWYLTLIIFYYLLYPWVFIKRAPLVSAGILLAASIGMLSLNLPIDKDVVKLYTVHNWTFPLGMVLAILVGKYRINFNRFLRILVIILCLGVWGYTAIYSGVGDTRFEQTISIITSLAILLVFGFWKISVKLLAICGIYSYEIYLIHWPILSRYNLFTGLSPAMMVVANLMVIVGLGYGLQKISKVFSK